MGLLLPLALGSFDVIVEGKPLGTSLKVLVGKLDGNLSIVEGVWLGTTFVIADGILVPKNVGAKVTPSVETFDGISLNIDGVSLGW